MPHSGCMRINARFLRLSKLKKLRQTEQVAAVCYRMRGGNLEFLLVKTGGGRWIFPKGGVEPGLTHAQAAAVEAFEEAGVRGRIEEKPFGQYKARRPGKRSEKQNVMAHLCQVLKLGPPQEKGRSRTWFSAEKAKKVLREDRSKAEGDELARVVSRATNRIKQLQEEAISEAPTTQLKMQNDPLQKVHFEGPAIGQPQNRADALYMRYIRRMHGDAQRWADSDFAFAGLIAKPVPRLAGSTGTAAVIHKVTAIDQGRGSRSKARI